MDDDVLNREWDRLQQASPPPASATPQSRPLTPAESQDTSGYWGTTGSGVLGALARTGEGAIEEFQPIIGPAWSGLHQLAAAPSNPLGLAPGAADRVPLFRGPEPGDFTTPEGAARLTGADQFPVGTGFWPNVAAGAERGAGAGLAGGLAAGTAALPFVGPSGYGMVPPAVIAGAAAGAFDSAIHQKLPQSTADWLGPAVGAVVGGPLSVGRAAITRGPGLLTGLVGAGVGAFAHHVTGDFLSSGIIGTAAKVAVDHMAHSFLSGVKSASLLPGMLAGAVQGAISARAGGSNIDPAAIQQNQLQPNFLGGAPPI